MIFLCLIALKNKTVIHIFFHRSHANGPLCKERLLRFGNVTPDLSSIFFEAAICENCCFMRVDQRVKLRSQSAEEVECLRESEPFATYVNF